MVVRVRKKGLHADLLDVARDWLHFTLRMADGVLLAQVLLDEALAFAHEGLAKLAREDAATESGVDRKMWNGQSANGR